MSCAIGAPPVRGPTVGSTPEPASRRPSRRSRWTSPTAAGIATDASIRRSDWWPSALGIGRLRLMRSESTQATSGGSVQAVPDRAIRAWVCDGEADRDTALSHAVAGSRGRWRAAAAPGSRDPCREPRLVLRLRRVDHDGPPHAELRRQGRIPRQLDDATAAAGAGHDPRRPRRWPPRHRRTEARCRGPERGQHVRHLPGRHPVTRRSPPLRPHGRCLSLDGHGGADRACWHRRDQPRPAAWHEGPTPVPTGHRPVRKPDRPHAPTPAAAANADG